MQQPSEFTRETWDAAASAGARPSARQLTYALAVLWLALLALVFQGSRGIWEPDEGRYLAVAQQMLQTGNFLVPQLESGQSHLTKPPLTYWAIAGSMAMFGHSELVARLPNALAFVLTGLLILWIAELLRFRHAWWPVAIWSTTLLPFVAANIVTTDSLLTLFETAAAAGFVVWRQALHGEGGYARARRGLWLMWLGFGLAFLVKGPPGLLPLIPLLIFSQWERGAAGLRALLAPAPLLAFLAIALWWFVYLLATHDGLLRYFLVYEVVDRVVTSVHQRNPGWMGLLEVYGATLVAGLLPWSVVVLISRWRSGARMPLDWNRRLLLLWWLLPLLVFLLAQSRLHLYLLPLSVPIALWSSCTIERQARFGSRLVVVLATLSATLLVGLKGYAAHITTRKDSRALATELTASIDLNQYRRLVFLEDSPRYGLGFYLRQPISSARLAPPAENAPALPDDLRLCDELSVNDSTLYLVSFRYAEPAIAIARACGQNLGAVGHTREFALLAIGEGPSSP